MPRATTLLSRVAIAPIRRLLTTTTVPPGATTRLPTAVTPRRAATTHLLTAIILHRAPSLRLRLTLLHVEVPRRVVTLRQRLAPLVVDLAVDSTVAAVADPTAE